MKRLMIGLILFCALGEVSLSQAIPVNSRDMAVHTPYRNFDTIHLNLSSTDLNTVVFLSSIKLDKSVNFMGPEDRYSVERDSTGQIYLMVKAGDPFTLYVTTQQQHHVALYITPRAGQGRTEVLTTAPLKPVPLHVKSKKAMPVSVQTRLKQLATHQLPKSFHAIHLRHHPIKNLSQGVQVKLMTVMTNGHETGKIYTVQNTTHRIKGINPKKLFKASVTGVRLSQRLIPAKGAIWLYLWEGKPHG